MATYSSWAPDQFAAVPPLFPDTAGANSAGPSRHVRRWNVTHACDSAECILPLTDAQAEVGMGPALLTPTGWFNKSESSAPAPRVSLIHAWREVRHWRGLFDEHGIGAPAEILHAHCFSAGMAALRAGLTLVYDFSEPVGSGASAGPWLTGSLRVAEGFVLSRAAAVVVHTQRMWDLALTQGVRAEDLFLIADPVALPHGDSNAREWLAELCGTRPGMTFFCAPESNLEILLRAFSVLAGEIEDAHLLVESPNATAVERHTGALDIAGRVHVVCPSARSRALACTDVVIAGATAEAPNPLVLDALAHGRAVLAADHPANREVTPHGRGCLWYAPGSPRDLAFRAAFLARNPGFCEALGVAGRAHIQATRGASNVARQYDEVYRHALNRQRGGPDLLHRVPALALCC